MRLGPSHVVAGLLALLFAGAGILRRVEATGTTTQCTVSSQCPKTPGAQEAFCLQANGANSQGTCGTLSLPGVTEDFEVFPPDKYQICGVQLSEGIIATGQKLSTDDTTANATRCIGATILHSRSTVSSESGNAKAPYNLTFAVVNADSLIFIVLASNSSNHVPFNSAEFDRQMEQLEHCFSTRSFDSCWSKWLTFWSNTTVLQPDALETATVYTVCFAATVGPRCLIGVVFLQLPRCMPCAGYLEY